MNNTVEERLARIETKIDALLGKDDDHETRIRVLEQWKARLTGIAFAVSAVVSLGVSLLGKVM